MEDDGFSGPNATFASDLFPRSKQHPAEFARTTIRRGASISANVTPLDGISVGVRGVIGAVVRKTISTYVL